MWLLFSFFHGDVCCVFFFSSRRRHTRCALVTGVQTCALPIFADHAAFAPAELVIEAATEREEIKRAIFASVGAHLSDTAILATNTSSIPITRLAQASPDPARFIGVRSEEHTSELQSLMRISYAVFCLKKKNTKQLDKITPH